PRGGREHAREHPQHRGLPRAVRAEQTDHLAATDGEADVGGRDHLAKALGESPGLDHRGKSTPPERDSFPRIDRKSRQLRWRNRGNEVSVTRCLAPREEAPRGSRRPLGAEEGPRGKGTGNEVSGTSRSGTLGRTRPLGAKEGPRREGNR